MAWMKSAAEALSDAATKPRTVARKPKAPRFTAAERAILDPLAVRCIVACVEASRAEERWRKESPRGMCGALAEECVATKNEVFAAGKAFGRALTKLRGGK